MANRNERNGKHAEQRDTAAPGQLPDLNKAKYCRKCNQNAALGKRFDFCLFHKKSPPKKIKYRTQYRCGMLFRDESYLPTPVLSVQV